MVSLSNHERPLDRLGVSGIGVLMANLWMLAAILLLLLVAGCRAATQIQNASPTLTPTATPTLAPLPSGYWPMENYIKLADVIVIGNVTECAPIQDGPELVYQDCTLAVEEYLTKPLPYDRLIVRSLWAVIQDNTRHPVKESRLAPGEHVLLFLDKRPSWDLQDDQYGLLGPMGGKFWIEDDNVRNAMWEAPLVPLGELIRQIPQ